MYVICLARAISEDTMLTIMLFIFQDKTVKLWKVTERDKQPSGFNLKDEHGLLRDPSSITTLRVPRFE